MEPEKTVPSVGGFLANQAGSPILPISGQMWECFWKRGVLLANFGRFDQSCRVSRETHRTTFQLLFGAREGTATTVSRNSPFSPRYLWLGPSGAWGPQRFRLTSRSATRMPMTDRGDYELISSHRRLADGRGGEADAGRLARVSFVESGRATCLGSTTCSADRGCRWNREKRPPWGAPR